MHIQLLTSFLSKYIHVSAVDIEFLPDVKNNPSNPHTHTHTTNHLPASFFIVIKHPVLNEIRSTTTNSKNKSKNTNFPNVQGLYRCAMVTSCAVVVMFICDCVLQCVCDIYMCGRGADV